MGRRARRRTDHVWVGTVEDCPELFVVHHGNHTLALEYVAQLGGREPSVERDRIGTELGKHHDRLDEAGVVPTQHAYLRPHAHAAPETRWPTRCCAGAAPRR